jgi:hypothetical protein
MKKALKFMGLLGLFLTIGAFQANAQGKKSLVLNAPFAFTVEKQQMPAGSYRILVERNYLQIRGQDGQIACMVLTLPTSGRVRVGSGEVVFHRFGNRYFLNQVWLPDMETGRQTLESPSQSELKKREQLEVVVIKLETHTGR